MSDIYSDLASRIIKQQEGIIGPLALSEAQKVSGLIIGENGISITGDGKSIVENLVKRYENLFGQTSIEVCKEAVRPLVSGLKHNDIPDILL